MVGIKPRPTDRDQSNFFYLLWDIRFEQYTYCAGHFSAHIVFQDSLVPILCCSTVYCIYCVAEQLLCSIMYCMISVIHSIVGQV